MKQDKTKMCATFVMLAIVAGGGYVLYRGLEMGLAQVVQQAGPVVSVAQRGLGFAEELGRRALGRAGSEAAQ